MATTPATRVSRTLHKGGLPTTLPSEIYMQGNKVSNTSGTPLGLRSNREFGHATVWIRFDFDSPSLAQERREQAAEILTAAGYRVEKHPDPESTILHVWEPNWYELLSEVGRAIHAEAGSKTSVEWRADKERDGLITVHRTDCPREPIGTSRVVRGRTREDIGVELNGNLIKKSLSPERNYKIVKLHTCITEQE
ncbi:hypothetical protein [Nonomuraea typhae]|uniref:Uncharacterized protein n=1 Tax=Nonomuraea typhae TaxID=2603600 RepID=A0ABW7YKU3_9ACTN